ncbi:MAG: hypothetical protein EA378_10455 [Phycisphaerales bacterium]|nr:MAG: hypothetical protein EA378_10455 [Phycisphaerales bacterium]
MPRLHHPLRLACLCLLLLGAGAFGGCALPQVVGLRDEAAAFRDAARHQAAQLEREAHEADRAGEPRRADRLRSDASRLLASGAAADAAARQLDTLLDDHDRLRRDPVLGELGQHLPEPLRSPVLLGAAALAAAWRARQLKTGLTSVAQSLEKAMQEDPELAARVKAHAPTLRAIQTGTAHRVIDEATKRETMLRLPL